MTAPALNPAQFAPAGLNAAGNANANPANGALAGFEALMAALFPSADVAAVPVAATPVATAPAPAIDALLVDATGIEGDAEADAAAAGPEVAENAGVDAATAALVADSLVPPAPIAEAPKTVTAEAAAAQDAPVSVDPRATSAEAVAATTAETSAAEDVDATTASPANTDDQSAEPSAASSEPERPKTPESAGRPAQPPAWGQDKSHGAPAAPALANANPHANLAAKAAAATVETPTETPEAPVAVAEDQARAAAPPAVPAKAEPAPPQSSSRSAKTERSKASAEPTASNDVAPATVTEAPTEAKARDVAVRAAAQAPVDAVERKTDDAKPAADTPDFTIQSEARADSSSSTAPTEATTRAVRGAPETVANLAAQIIKKLDARTTRFDVELDPHGLGKVDVRVEIGANGRVTAAMTFDNPQAAQDVKARAGELQKALEQAGFDMSGGALSFDVAQDRGQGGQGRTWQDQQNDTASTFRGQAFRAALETAGDAADAANQGALRLSRGVRAGLDVRI